jgi:hypothetical protein
VGSLGCFSPYSRHCMGVELQSLGVLMRIVYHGVGFVWELNIELPGCSGGLMGIVYHGVGIVRS